MKCNQIVVTFITFWQIVCSSDLDESIGNVENAEQLVPTQAEISGDCHQAIECTGNQRYRSANGACNNLRKPALGMSFRAQARFLDSIYDQDKDSLRNNPDLPSPREVSNQLFNANGEESFSSRHTVQLMAWGQFLCHDVVATPSADGGLDCCDDANKGHPNCLPIKVPESDPYFSNTRCLNFVRSAAANKTCHKGRREQINDITSFIDGSMVYGSTDEQMQELRSSDGTLKMKDNILLPENPHGQCAGEYCQLAGDERADEVPNLGINHLLFVRLHNKIAVELRVINPSWTSDLIFQEARKIVGAIIQHITYNEYLPILLGEAAVVKNKLKPNCKKYPFKDYYNPNIDPTIRNGFAVAALRIGHTQIMPRVSLLNTSYHLLDEFGLPGQFFNTTTVVGDNGSNIQGLTRWLTHAPCMKTDRFFQPEVRNRLFENIHSSTLKSEDLPSRNIMRGRDHGIPGYNAYRQFCGLTKIDFNDQPIADHDESSSTILKQLYKSEDDIDLYAGGVSELREGEGLMGPTFQCIFVRQFQNLKFGDSHFYERSRGEAGFNRCQLQSIKGITLAKLFCDNYNLKVIQKQAFEKVKALYNPLQSCGSLPGLDLSLWKDDRYLSQSCWKPNN